MSCLSSFLTQLISLKTNNTLNPRSNCKLRPSTTYRQPTRTISNSISKVEHLNSSRWSNKTFQTGTLESLCISTKVLISSKKVLSIQASSHIPIFKEVLALEPINCLRWTWPLTCQEIRNIITRRRIKWTGEAWSVTDPKTLSKCYRFRVNRWTSRKMLISKSQLLL